MATRDEILQACADQSPEAVISLAQTCPDPPTEMQLAYKAAQNGNSALLHWLLHNAATLLSRGTLLNGAASALSKPCMQNLLDDGLDINLANNPDMDVANDDIGGVIHSALRNPDCIEDFIAWLLKRGADPNIVDAAWQRHVLVYAMTHGPNGSMPIVKVLIAYGADVNRAKALHFAASCNDIEKARFLVEEAGANTDKPGVPKKDFYWERGPRTPLHSAVARDHSRRRLSFEEGS